MKGKICLALAVIELNTLFMMFKPEMFTQRIILHILKCGKIPNNIVEVEKMSPSERHRMSLSINIMMEVYVTPWINANTLLIV